MTEPSRTKQAFDAIRKAAAPGVWSQGVRLARAPNGVAVTKESPSECECRVAAPMHSVPLTVTIYFGDIEWSCDCMGATDPCAHVVAAIIGLESEQGAGGAGVAQPTPEEVAPAPATSSAHISPTVQGPLAPIGSAAVTSRNVPPTLPHRDPAVYGAERDARTMTLVRGQVRQRRKLGYRFVTEPAGVSLTRFTISADGTNTPLRAPLSSPISRPLVMEVAPREQDLHLDRLIGQAVQKYRVSTTLGAVMAALDGAPNVFLGERPVTVNKEPVMPLVQVLERGDSFELRFERSKLIDEVVAPGLALVGTELRPLGDTERAGMRFERLPLAIRYRGEQTGELVSKVLVDLEKRMVVEYLSDKLPGRTRTLRPRIDFELVTEGEVLVVRASLVYGTPPVARVVASRLVQLGQVTPRRLLDAEKQLELSLREDLDVLLDRPLRLEGVDAGRFIERLERWKRGQSGASTSSGGPASVELRAVIAIIDGEPVLQFQVEGTGLDGDVASIGVAPPEVILRAHLEGIEQIPLATGHWGRLPVAWLAEHSDLLADYLAARDASSFGRNAAKLLLGTSAQELGLKTPAGFDDYASILASKRETELPSDLIAELRPYQSEGIGWLSALRDSGMGGILADDMGLGKTLQTIAVLRGRSLIVVPKSVIFNWRAELHKFRPGLTVSVYHGSDRVLDEGASVTLTTYAILRLDQDKLCPIEWDCVVLDESQTIKNTDSQATQAAHALRGKFRLALTGTPIENRLEELWSGMHFANPGLLGGLSSFKKRFVEPLEQGDPDVSARLRRRVNPFVLRRLKTEVAKDLPPKTEDVLWVLLEPEERTLYDAILSDSRKELRADPEKARTAIATLEILLRLRQICCHSGLLPGRTDTQSSKLERLMESLDEVLAEGQKAIVFSQWTGFLDKVEPALRERSIRILRLDGSTTDRQSVVRIFQEEKAYPVLLASLKAGGTGLNLTAADHVYLLDPWWNPAAEAQAADRAHRIGRERPVFVHRLIAKDTVEERVMALQDKKRALGQFVDGADPTTGITREELEELLT